MRGVRGLLLGCLFVCGVLATVPSAGALPTEAVAIEGKVHRVEDLAAGVAELAAQAQEDAGVDVATGGPEAPSVCSIWAYICYLVYDYTLGYLVPFVMNTVNYLVYDYLAGLVGDVRAFVDYLVWDYGMGLVNAVYSDVNALLGFVGAYVRYLVYDVALPIVNDAVADAITAANSALRFAFAYICDNTTVCVCDLHSPELDLSAWCPPRETPP